MKTFLITLLIGLSAFGQVTRKVDADVFKRVTGSASGSIIVLPSFAGTISTTSGTETLLNKTLTSPVINGGSVSAATVVNPIITSATITGSSYTGGTVSGVSIIAGTIAGAAITGGSVSAASIVNPIITSATMTLGSISGTAIIGGSISGTTISGLNFNNVTLSGTTVVQGSITSGTISGTILIQNNALLTASATLTAQQEQILVSGTAVITITLPSAATVGAGKVFTITQASVSNQAIIAAASTVCGQASVRLSGLNDSVSVISDGTVYRGLYGTCFRSEIALIAVNGGVTELPGSDWINGSCTNASPRVCTFNSGTFSSQPYCETTGYDVTQAGSKTWNAFATASSITIVERDSPAGTGSQAMNFQLFCKGNR